MRSRGLFIRQITIQCPLLVSFLPEKCRQSDFHWAHFKIIHCLRWHLLFAGGRPQQPHLDLIDHTNTPGLYGDSRPAAATFLERKACEISIQPRPAVSLCQIKVHYRNWIGTPTHACTCWIQRHQCGAFVPTGVFVSHCSKDNIALRCYITAKKWS